MSQTDIFYDLMDEACMLLNERLHLNYLDCLIRVGKDLIYGIHDQKLEEEDVNALNRIYHKIEKNTFMNEEIRQALELLVVKAFKHKGYSLDLMTPDYVCYLFAYLIQKLFNIHQEDEITKRFTMLDIGLGTSNLTNAIVNFLHSDVECIGVEQDEHLVQLSQVFSDLEGNHIKIYYQNALQKIMDVVDIIIGDLDGIMTNDGSYQPYEIIKSYEHNLDKDGYFIYMIPNDFFQQAKMKEFKASFMGTFLGLIVLPPELFQKNQIGKSILIGTYQYIASFDMMVVQMPSVHQTKEFQNTCEKIEKWIENMEEKKNENHVR